MDHQIIATGSRGNAVRIGKTMFDCGIPFSKMKKELYKVDTLLITHSHTDHINPTTLASIKREFPHIKIYANAHVAYDYQQVDVIIGTKPFDRPGRHIIPFDGVHDVPVTGYIVQDEILYLYATDTSRIEPPEGYLYDEIYLQSNYDEVKLRMESANYKSGKYDPAQSSRRHLSKQKCKEFYYLNRRDENSKLYELHKSSRFY